jgi:hypothetical protein
MNDVRALAMLKEQLGLRHVVGLVDPDDIVEALAEVVSGAA